MNSKMCFLTCGSTNTSGEVYHAPTDGSTNTSGEAYHAPTCGSTNTSGEAYHSLLLQNNAQSTTFNS